MSVRKVRQHRWWSGLQVRLIFQLAGYDEICKSKVYSWSHREFSSAPFSGYRPGSTFIGFWGSVNTFWRRPNSGRACISQFINNYDRTVFHGETVKQELPACICLYCRLMYLRLSGNRKFCPDPSVLRDESVQRLLDGSLLHRLPGFGFFQSCNSVMISSRFHRLHLKTTSASFLQELLIAS